MAGLIGLGLAGPLGSEMNGMLLAVTPIAMLGLVKGLRTMMRREQPPMVGPQPSV
jgi:hypothetical protein